MRFFWTFLPHLVQFEVTMRLVGTSFQDTELGFCAGPQCGVFLSPGFFHAPRIPRSDVGEGALSKSHGPRASWTSILKTGRSTILYRPSHETIPASLSRFAEETNLGKDMRIIQENTRKTPQNTQRPVHSKPADWWDSVMAWPAGFDRPGHLLVS